MRLASLVVLAVLLAGCSARDDATPTPPTPPSTLPSAIGTPSPPPSTPATPTPAGPAPTLRLIPDALAVQPGQAVALLVEVTSPRPGMHEIAIDAFGRTFEASVALRASVPGGSWIEIEVPPNPPPGASSGSLLVTLAGEPVALRSEALALRVLSSGPGVEPGDAVVVHYVGRLEETGQVFNTNEPALESAAFARLDSYSFSEGPFRVTTAPRPSVVEGFYEGLLGMQEGESRMVTFGPEKGYGPATFEEIDEREQTVERDLTVPNHVQHVPRGAFESYANETDQADADGPSVGDRFTLFQGGSTWPYSIVEVTADLVGYKLAVAVGEDYTVYPQWPNASEVNLVNDTNIVFRTTPSTPIGEPFTMREGWPNMSAVKSVNETVILVRHSPPVGHEYSWRTQGRSLPASVTAVTEDRIVSTVRSDDPLAGQALTFHIRVDSIEKGGAG